MEVTLETTLNPKVLRYMKNLQAPFNKDVKEITDQVKQVKLISENLNFLIDLATIKVVAMVKKSTEEESKNINEANHPDVE